MADYQNAGAALKAELARIQGLVNLVEVITEVASLEQAANEAKAAAITARADLDALNVQIDAAKSELSDAKAAVKKTKTAADDYVTKVSADATDAAARIIADAEAEASAAKSDAVAESHLAVVQAETLRDSALADRDVALRELQDYLSRVEVAKVELNSARIAIDAIRSQASKLIG